MIDIYSTGSGELETYDTQTHRAANILNTQLGALEYAPDLGIDLRYFLSPDYKFQDASFRSYLVQVLAASGINVATITDTVQNLYQSLDINLAPEDQSSGLIAR
jgi:hypothetical protein